MPKVETGALEFLKKHPDYDGRGIVVAIFDTGVDPGADGLLKTPDGRAKVIDIVDGTGSGDVDTSTVRKVVDGKLLGLSGKQFTIPEGLNSPSGEYHVGLKAGYDFFPSDGGELVSRIKQERSEDQSEADAKLAMELRVRIKAWKAKEKDLTDDQKLALKEAEAQLELLELARKHHSDVGPLFDCIVFHNGKEYQAVIDTDRDGDLADEKVLRNYRQKPEYGTFAAPYNLNFGVNIYDDGNLLSIVADSGAHGTHVAGIVAAYYPDHPELNGIAPGAQIVSVKIGDNRMIGMETGPGFERGISAVLDNKCDLINMSYGEPTITPNQGRLTEYFRDLVREHNVIFVSSAGNSGPALSTVGAPGGTTSEIIGVGAYVSPQMQKVDYTLRDDLPGLPFTWTSRGPTTDGDWGVDLFAPGAAHSPIPTWTLTRSGMFNGTSMASPNACGNIALMLSAAKREKLPYNPASIRKAIQATAKTVPDADKFAQGAGLLQVVAAYEHLKANATQLTQQTRFKINVTSRDGGRGIYLREPFETNEPSNHLVYVGPDFPESTTNAEKIAFEARVRLQATADWVTVGPFLLLTSKPGRFEVKVDPTGLEPGVHTAEVQAFDETNLDAGAVFTVPVTVVIPHALDHTQLNETVEFERGRTVRRFVDVPHGATWAKLTLTPKKLAGQSQLFRVHTLQLVDGRHFEAVEGGGYLRINSPEPKYLSFDVVPGRTLEVCMAQYWSSLGSFSVDYQLEFFGVEPSEHEVTLTAGEALRPVDLRAGSHPVTIAPSAKLSTHRRTFLPKSHATIMLDTGRYLTDDEEAIYELQLTYEFNQASNGRVTPRFPALEDLLYDATVGPFLFTIYDANDKPVTTNDMFPDAASLKKGDYKLICHIRHHDQDELGNWEKLRLCLDASLGSPISVDLYKSPAAYGAGDSGLGSITLTPNATTRIYFGEPAASKIPSTAKPGDILLGNVTYADSEDLAGKATKPGGFEIRYVVGHRDADKSAASPGGVEVKGTSEEDFAKQLFQLKLAQLKKLDIDKDKARFEALFAELEKSHPQERDLYMARLHALDNDDRKQRLEEVVAAADEVIGMIDQTKLAAHFGMRQQSDAAKKQHKEFEKQKEDLVDALYRKGRAIGYMELPDVIEKKPIEDEEAFTKRFEAAYQELAKWVDPTDEDYYLLAVRRHRRLDETAQAIKLLYKHYDDDNPRFLHLKKLRDMYGELGWEQMSDAVQDEMLVRFPKKSLPYE